MTYPEIMVETVQKITKKYSDDIPTAIEKSLEAIQALDDYAELQEMLIRSAVQDLVYDSRHNFNKQTKRDIRRDVGNRSEGPKRVNVGDSEFVRASYENLLDYCIGSKTLGALFGEELPALAEQEASVAVGHLFNSRLLNELSRFVPPKKMVRDSINKEKMAQIWETARIITATTQSNIRTS